VLLLSEAEQAARATDHANENDGIPPRVWKEVNRKLTSLAKRQGREFAVAKLMQLTAKGRAAKENFVQVAEILVGDGAVLEALDLVEVAAATFETGYARVLRPIARLSKNTRNADLAEEILALMDRLQIPWAEDAYVLGDCLHSLFRASRLTRAEKVFQDAVSSRHVRHVALYNAMVQGYVGQARSASLNRALAILRSMQAAEVMPNEVTFNSLLAGFTRVKDFAQAKAVAAEMITLGITPGVTTYNTLINLFGLHGQLSEALSLFEEVKEKLTPNV